MSPSSDLDNTPLASTPFLKWPGGKRWLAPILSTVFARELEGTYFEPFLGAGAVFTALHPNQAVLSDQNTQLIRFWKTVRYFPDDVVRAVWRWSNTAECYELVRQSNPRTEIGHAAKFLFLNRTCWGGIYRTNRRGQFNVPFGGSGRRLCSLRHVKSVAKVFNTADLVVQDFEPAITLAQSGDVVYADPPYTAKGENNGFIRYNERLFSWKDQERLAKVARSAKSRGVFVAVSGLLHNDILALYPGWWFLKLDRQSRVGIKVSSRKLVSEVVLFSRKPKHLPQECVSNLSRVLG